VNTEPGPEPGSAPMIVHKLRTFSNHPLFIETMADRTAAAFERIPEEQRGQASLVFTAHSVPVAMAQSSAYEQQLRTAAELITQRVAGMFGGNGRGGNRDWTLAFQSRSGPPTQPWLEPDIGDWLRKQRPRDVVVVPLGFISDHMEVLYDLDTEAAQLCDELGIHMVRAGTAGTHPKFIAMIEELILERTHPGTPRRWEGVLAASTDECPETCCLPLRRP
jgi:ferrochelatase